jgi:hypothetical protein
MDDLQSQAIGLLDEAGVHLDKIPGMAVLTGVSLFAATVGDDLRHNYMLHYWVCARTSVTYLLCFVIMLHAHWSALGQCYTYKATEQTRLLHLWLLPFRSLPGHLAISQLHCFALQQVGVPAAASRAFTSLKQCVCVCKLFPYKRASDN